MPDNKPIRIAAVATGILVVCGFCVRNAEPVVMKGVVASTHPTSQTATITSSINRVKFERVDGVRGPSIIRLLGPDAVKLRSVLRQADVSFVSTTEKGKAVPWFDITCNQEECTAKIWGQAICEFDDSKTCSITTGHFFPNEDTAKELYERMDIESRQSASKGGGDRYTTSRVEKRFVSEDGRFQLTCAAVSSQDEYRDTAAVEYDYCEMQVSGIPRLLIPDTGH
jgi:hypothetical protein